MKPPLKLFPITILAASVAWALSGCGKKASAPEASETGLTEAEVAAVETEIAASEATVAVADANADVIAADEAVEDAEIAAFAKKRF